MSTSGKRRIVVVGLAATSLALAACSSSSSDGGGGGGGSTTSGGSQSLTTVTYGSSPLNASHIWQIVAQDEPTMSQYGIKLKVVTFQNNGQAVSALAGGSVDISEASAPQAVAAIQKQPDFKIIFGTQTGSVQSLVAQKGINSIADLKGKKISVNAVGASSDYFTAAAILAANGLSTKDVNFVNGGGSSERNAAFVSGAYSAGMFSPPVIDMFTSKGAKELASGNDVGFVAQGLTYAAMVKNSWYTSNKDVALRFIEGFQATRKFMADPANKTKVVADIAKALNTDTAGATQVYEYVITGGADKQDPSGAFTTASLQASLKLSTLKPVADSVLSGYYDLSLVHEASAKTGVN